MTMNYVYLVDGDRDQRKRIPIASLDDTMPFKAGSKYEYWLTGSTDRSAPFAESYVSEDGVNCASLHFYKDATPGQRARVRRYLKRKDLVDQLQERWGPLHLCWSKSDGCGLDGNHLVVCCDNEGDWIRLDLVGGGSKTYRHLRAEYAFLRILFLSAFITAPLEGEANDYYAVEPTVLADKEWPH